MNNQEIIDDAIKVGFKFGLPNVSDLLLKKLAKFAELTLKREQNQCEAVGKLIYRKIDGHFEFDVVKVNYGHFTDADHITRSISIYLREQPTPSQSDYEPNVWGYISDEMVKWEFTDSKRVMLIKKADGYKIVELYTKPQPTSQDLVGAKTCECVSDISESMPGTYSGSCGIVWTFTEGNLRDNECNFCQRCGGKTIEAGL